MQHALHGRGGAAVGERRHHGKSPVAGDRPPEIARGEPRLPARLGKRLLSRADRRPRRILPQPEQAVRNRLQRHLQGGRRRRDERLCGLRPRLPRGRPRHGRADGRLVRRAAARQAHTHICLAGSSTDTSAIVYGLLTGKHSLGKHAPSAEARDAAKAAKLWELSEGLIA